MLYQAVIDGEYENYYDARVAMKPDNWRGDCPLCEYDSSLVSGYCDKCLSQKGVRSEYI